MTSIEAMLLAFCEWCNASFFGSAIRDSVWLFPFVEIFHLLALATLGGTMLVLNLRLLGLRFPRDSVPDLAREFQPWIVGSIVVLLVSGFLLFSTEAVKMYGNWAFQLKMLFLLLAIIFTFTFHRRAILAVETPSSRPWRRVAAVVSILLWTGVGLGGRALGYITTAAS